MMIVLGKGTLTNDYESSDEDVNDIKSDGIIETSSSSSDFDEISTDATKPKVVIVTSKTTGQSSCN